MPPFKKVPSLRDLGRDKVLYKICEIIVEEMFFSSDENWEVFGPPYLSVRLQMVRDVLLNSLCPSILQDILNIILEKDTEIEATIRYIALQLLLVKGVCTLKVGSFPESYYTFVLDAIAESCANLRNLDLRGLWIRPNDIFSFCKVIRRIHDIRHLIIKYVCVDEFLQLIGKHCIHLEILNIAGSGNISEEGIEKLINNPSKTIDGYTSDICKTLQIIDLGGPGATQLSPSLAAKLIENVPHLKSLGSFPNTGKSIEILYELHPNSKYGLRYIHDTSTNSQRLSAICKLCPDIQAIYFDSPGSTAVKHLHMLKCLTEIKLHKVKWEDVKLMLENCGQRIRNLILLMVWGSLVLSDLGSLCPNIIRLEMHFVTLICSDVSHSTALKNIKEIFIYNSDITTVCAKFIINQCLTIQTLSLGDCAQLTDAAIISSLLDKSLLNVQSVWFGLAENLTKRTIEALIEHCPNLSNLGNLAAWNVRQNDIDLLRIQLLTSNLDLTLHEYGPEEEEIIQM
ncbi:UNVERIFIED_CONTAM: hypothetical protein RMT77_010991 [Armadillidium vulgare]